MPNHVVNIVTFEGDTAQIQKMLSEVQNDEFGPGSISFQKLIPMPPELDIECSFRTGRARKAYNDYLSQQPVSEDAYLQAHPDLDRETFMLGKKASANIDKYGAPTWYDWRIDHWGTKWDAYGYDEGTDYSKSKELRFLTAWNAPHSILQKLSEQYPALEINHQWADEDIGFMAERTRTLAFQVPESLFQRIKDYLARNQMTQRAFVIGLIEEELDRDEELLHQQEQDQEDTEEEQGDGPVEDETPDFAPEVEQPEYDREQGETQAVGSFEGSPDGPGEEQDEGFSEDVSADFAPEDEQPDYDPEQDETQSVGGFEDSFDSPSEEQDEGFSEDADLDFAPEDERPEYGPEQDETQAVGDFEDSPDGPGEEQVEDEAEEEYMGMSM